MEAPERAELLTLADDWMAADGHWRRFLTIRLKANRAVNGITNGTFNIPSIGDRPVIVTYPSTPSHATGVFLQFVLHPKQGPLYRCQRETCKHFFLRKSAHKSVYCDKRCARADTASLAMKKAREKKQKEKAATVNSVLKTYSQGGRRGDWRIYVETETGLSQRTINNLFNRNLIQGPKERKRAK